MYIVYIVDLKVHKGRTLSESFKKWMAFIREQLFNDSCMGYVKLQ